MRKKSIKKPSIIRSLLYITTLLVICGAYFVVRNRSELNVSGTVHFIEQGPTDAPIGKSQTSATISQGSAQDYHIWRKRSGTIAKDTGVTENALLAAARPATIKVIETPEGKYRLGLTAQTDVICVIRIVGTGAGDYYEPYDCRQFSRTDGNLKANITLIGFGRSGFDCEHSCIEFTP